MTNVWNPPGGGGANWGTQPQQPQQPPQQQQPQQQQPPPQQPWQQQPPPQQPWQQPQQQPQPQYQPPQAAGYAQNPFQGLTSGDPSSTRHPFLKDGSYKLRLHSIKFVQSRGGKALYIVEEDVVESNNPMCPPGLRCSSFIDMSNMDTRGRHIAAFVTAVHGFDPESLPKDSPVAPWNDPQTGKQEGWDYYALQSVHDTNPWAGREVGVHVQTIKTQRGTDFTLHTWVPAAGLTLPAAAPQQAAPPQTAAVQQSGPPNQGGWPQAGG